MDAGTTDDAIAAGQKSRDVKSASRSPFAELRMQLDQLSQHLNVELTTCALTVDAKEQELSDLLKKRGCGWEDAQHVWGVTHDEEIQASSPAVKHIQSASGLEQNPGHDDSLVLQGTLNGAAATSLSSTEHDEWSSYLK